MLQNKRLYMDEKSKALFEDKWFSDYERKEILETKIVENGIHKCKEKEVEKEDDIMPGKCLLIKKK